ncbi:MAG: hypothetical protein A2W61_01320 [Deltaproteobacteria bacterium RIFCSPLOWO2_01_44_7]|nr:MAG: hypothetical protein A2712_02370 [Deltaproteobacteria bacterium RIFCSPHIGHO2_01_FULL_43_49]OGQ15032.1 MAG: hypothetical protein A3D22_03110 [Deltaproteobacteria bacterium RIFCSPHIGHO2_02_FULL_44_53]OGQ27349.1 MAG: hypothetical protein A3D98_02965 [Deltaproteobacteria bacterium RIFCSPHIGHO2_12_FULL_44_21]OGQ31549.1 MAG: hypothetical protein A2979_04270 [Deltaproteobacteria bacterium RIFCSPLOWO2_01_FULL_45_74]OGQ39018.1 MAG: hypothetical protein A2W61_01320 [Deltaproteobacteria bacterium 
MIQNKIAVIGLGHVGLTLALTFAEEGFPIIGIEKSLETLEHLKNIRPPFFEGGLENLLKKHLGHNLTITPQLPDNSISAYILCVGTPIDEKEMVPYLKSAESAMREVALNMKDGALVILRSTVPVGTSRNFFIPILQETRKKFYYACCPERTCEGVALKELRELPQIVGGIDDASYEMAAALFRKIAPKIVKVPCLETAEIAKLMDNCWRDATFAFANEMALLCESLGLDATEVIDLANLGYERNTIPRPGFVGGPCLTKDPYLLTKSVDKKMPPLTLTPTARLVNKQLPEQVAKRVLKFVNENGKDAKQCKVFLSGFSFKGHPATDDLRGSCSLDLFYHLRKIGFTQISGHDFVVSKSELEKLDIPFLSFEEGFDEADVVMILNNHSSYQKYSIDTLLHKMNKPGFFYDSWHLYSKEVTQKIQGIFHGGIGF